MTLFHILKKKNETNNLDSLRLATEPLIGFYSLASTASAFSATLSTLEEIFQLKEIELDPECEGQLHTHEKKRKKENRTAQ